ncbi:hypothetical protein HJC23_010500 [Cyclotella cryptica]|uniref:Cyclin N-terminal domain-containing protein n=1 Tax=Cyclotella cryptica TaxID=29204 RepID=A0ABD3QBE3_9STRA|eukprot:CCRYP_007097-RA/>CCRYP_007097-RA protein AED:0.03 eAED:0.03 QI:281/1/1/1/1/1/2/178/573
MSPTKRRSRDSIGSRTRSKRPATSNVELPVGGRKTRASNATTSRRRTIKASADNGVASSTEATEAETGDAKDVPVVETSGKRRRVAAARRVANTNVHDASQPSVHATSATIATAPPPNQSSSQPARPLLLTTTTAATIHTKPCNDTPRHHQPTSHHRNITPSPTVHSSPPSPAFPTAWQRKSHIAAIAAAHPPGVLSLHLLPHACCLHSHHRHDGYSWLSSTIRCPCRLDSDHNSSECLSECYYGHYGGERWERDGWGTERWWLEATAGAAATTTTTGAEEEEDERIARHLDYMTRQPHLNSGMRAILMDWLVEMSMEYGLHCETVYLSVVIVDRVLACGAYEGGDGGKKGEMVVEKDKLQCVGCACTLIASKLLEITPPTVKDFCYISDNSYTAKEILNCEAKICSLLKFNFNFTTPYEYVDRYLRASFASPLGRVTNPALREKMERMVFYLLDLSLLEYKFVAVKPCRIAAAAVYLARATLGIREPSWNPSPSSLFGESFQRSSRGFWTKTLEYYTGYDMWDLEESVKLLRRLQEKAEGHHLKSVFAKFVAEEFGSVALKTVLNEEGLGFF